MDSTDELVELRPPAELLREPERAGWGGGSARATGVDRTEGIDASKCVRVGVDPHGLVLTVDIDSGWRHRLTPKEFAPALMAAYRAAVVGALRTASESSPAPRAARDDLSASAGWASPADADPFDERSWQSWLADMRQRLREIDVAIEETERMESRSAGRAAARTVVGPRRCLTAEVHAGLATTLTVDIKIIQKIDVRQLMAEAKAVLRAAGQE